MRLQICEAVAAIFWQSASYVLCNVLFAGIVLILLFCMYVMLLFAETVVIMLFLIALKRSL